MSGVFKKIGKVFKKVVKVVKKVAIPALMVGAVVLTGGAAIGALPAIGTVLGKLAISGTLASVLGGAISMGAVGAVTSGAMAGLSGGSIWKGMKKGFVTGAVTGGVMGGLGMISPNGILSDMGIGSKAAHLKGLAATGKASPAQLAELASLQAKAGGAANPAAMPGPVQPVSVPPSTAAGASGEVAIGGNVSGAPNMANASQSSGLIGELKNSVASLPGAGTTGASSWAGGGAVNGVSVNVAQTAAPVAKSGLLGQSWVGPAMQGVGQVVGGIGSGMAASAQAKGADAQNRLAFDRSVYNYGYQNEYERNKKGKIPRGAMPIGQTQWYNYQPVDLAEPQTPMYGQAQPYYQIAGNQVVMVPPGSGYGG